MDEARIRNLAELRGVLAAAPEFSHMSRGERFFVFPIETRRLSGAADRINVVARQSLLEAAPVQEAQSVHITGELRSFNNKRGEGAKLVITVFARGIVFDGGEDINRVALSGTLCKAPNLRGICWGRRAREAALLGVGDRLELSGRIQSRPYIKLIDGQPVEKTAYEVSVTDMEAV